MSAPNRRPPLLVLIALLVAGTWFAWRTGGSSPVLWYDTLADQSIVRLCLDLDICPFAGVGSSFANITVAAGWAEMRLTLDTLGVSLNTLNQALNVLTGLSFSLVFIAGWRLGLGWWALATAPLLATLMFIHSVHTHVLYNSRFLIPIGSALLVTAIMAGQHRSLVWLIATSALAGLATNVHPVNGFLVGSVAWIALLFTGRRAMATLVGVGSFTAFTLLGAPHMWARNLGVFLEGIGPSMDYGTQGANLLLNFAWPWMAGSAVIVLICMVIPRLRNDRTWTILAAIFTPTFAVFMIAQSLRAVEGTDKYLIAFIGATALASVAVPVRILAVLLTHLPQRFLSFNLTKSATIAGHVLALAMIPAGGMVELPLNSIDLVFKGMSWLTIDDVHALSNHIESKGLTYDQAFRAVKSPVDMELLTAFRWLAPIEPSSDRPVDDRVIITVIKSPREYLPNPMPPNWVPIGQDRLGTLIAIWDHTWLDWSSVVSCTTGNPSPEFPDACRAVDMTPIPASTGQDISRPKGMPEPGAVKPYTLELRVDVDLPGGEGVRVLTMPRVIDVCAGRVVGVPDGCMIQDNGARAVLTSHSASKGTVTFRFDIGSPGCNAWSFPGFPPFFIDADPEQSRLFSSIFDAYFDAFHDAGEMIVPEPGQEAVNP